MTFTRTTIALALLVALQGCRGTTAPQDLISSELIGVSRTLTPAECLERTEDFLKQEYGTAGNEDVIIDRTREGPFDGVRLRTSWKHDHGYQIVVLFANGSALGEASEAVALLYYFSYRGDPPVWVERDWDLEQIVAKIKNYIHGLP